ncbi:MAG: dihydrofolate reductase family protein [Saprospiraceae bacterium]|nr:dihydrofolate reductase family protein [Saprospiraceae bacterium]
MTTRKLKLQVQMSMDGFIAGPNGEMDWLTFNWSEDLKNYVTELTASMDTILLGKNLAMGFIPHWQQVAASPENPEHDAGLIFTNTPKVVFTKKMDESPWPNTVLAKGDLAAEVNAIKAQDGRDMMVYGGGSFVSSLIREKLIDELHLFVNPAVLGSGMPIFQQVGEKQAYRLLNVKPCACGIVVLTYKTL